MVADGGRQVGRYACGFTLAFGRAVGVFDAVVYGPAEAVPFRDVASGELRACPFRVVAGELGECVTGIRARWW
jgi:hypothetical protein